VRAAEVLPREGAMRMRVDGQPLSRVEELDEEHRVDAEARHVLRAEPRGRLVRYGVAKETTVREDGQPRPVFTGDRRRGGHPVLGLTVTGDHRGRTGSAVDWTAGRSGSHGLHGL
jgi:hypothetical protein